MRVSKSLIVGVCLAFVVGTAGAFWVQAVSYGIPALMWLGRVAASNGTITVTMARAIEWSLMAHGAVFGYLAWKDSSDTTAPTSPPIGARLVVEPNQVSTRDNPDPTKWDSAAAGSRNPSPKGAFTASSSSDYPSSNQPICNIVTQAVGAPFDTYSFGTSYTKTTYLATTTFSNPGTPYVNAGSYTCSGSLYYLWSKTATFVPGCPAGYTASGSGASMVCTLSVSASSVQKPANKVPCEVLQNADGTWDIDPQNPACSSLAAALTKSADGKTLTYSKGDGTYDSVTTNTDGTGTVRTGSRTINYSPADSSGNATITSISDSAGTGTGGGTSGSGSGSTAGTGGVAVCGGPGLPACGVSVDDSAFGGKDSTMGALGDKVTQHVADVKTSMNAVSGSDRHGISFDWALQVPGTACESPRFGARNRFIDIDLCGALAFVREGLAWLLYVLLGWALFDMVTSKGGNK